MMFNEIVYTGLTRSYAHQWASATRPYNYLSNLTMDERHSPLQLFVKSDDGRAPLAPTIVKIEVGFC